MLLQRTFHRSILLLITGVVLEFTPSGIAQNLIPNPGFEYFSECPIANYHYSDASYWYTNVERSKNDFEWHERAYIHACDPQVEPWWPEEQGDATIRTMFSYDAIAERSLTQLIWTELLATLQKDSLYYIEFTTSPSLLYFPAHGSFTSNMTVPFNVGIKLESHDFDGNVDKLDPLRPDMIASQGAIDDKVPGSMQIGNCFTASGTERFFLYGFFLDETPISDYTYIGQSEITTIRYPIFTTDNFIIEKIKLDICCDSAVCDKDIIDFSGFTDDYLLPKKRIVWNDGVEGSKRSFPQSGRYRFIMETGCGSVNSTWINVEVETCKLKVFVPNAFSPNGDAINSFLTPRFSDDFELTQLRFSIFNRWGQLVYQRDAIHSPGWDGKIDGFDADTGSYIWQLEYTYLEGDTEVQDITSGSVLLFR